MYNKFSAKLDCLIMPVTTEKLPPVKVNAHSWNIPENLNLADSGFYVPGFMHHRYSYKQQHFLEINRHKLKGIK